MDFTVRQAMFGDIPLMCDLLSELFSIESDFSPDAHRQATGLKLLLSGPANSSLVLVAAKGEEIVGMCSVQMLISTAQGGPVGLLEDLIVLREYRGKGLGSRLLSETFKWCETKNISRLQLLKDMDNERARKFYACNGWTNTSLVCMRKMF